MTFKKVILVLTDSTDQAVVKEVIDLCKKFKSRLFVLFVIEANKISRLAHLTRQKTETLHKKVEEEGWQLLYLVEDAAVENGVWTSLHFEEGNMINILKKYVETYDINTVFMKRKDENKKIFISCSAPVIGL